MLYFNIEQIQKYISVKTLCSPFGHKYKNNKERYVSDPL